MILEQRGAMRPVGMKLYCVWKLVSTVFRADTQELEGIMNMIQSVARRGHWAKTKTS